MVEIRIFGGPINSDNLLLNTDIFVHPIYSLMIRSVTLYQIDNRNASTSLQLIDPRIE